MTKKYILLIGFLLLLCVFLPASAEHHENSHHGIDWAAVIAKFVNSSLLFGGLFYLLRKPLRTYISEQSVQIKDDITKRENDLQQAKNQMVELKDRLVSIEKEINELKDNARIHGGEEATLLLEKTKNSVDGIMSTAENEITLKYKIALQQLKSDIADHIITQFKTDIQSVLNETSHEKIIGENIEKLGDILERK
jgi:F-type H+-transporting ATPase subunit b